MNLPNTIKAFVKAQNTYDSAAHVACFNADAIVTDESKNHHGTNEIKAWIEETNAEYQTVMEPLDYSGATETGVLSAKISGTFEGSPIVLNYHFEFVDDLIQSLKISG